MKAATTFPQLLPCGFRESTHAGERCFVRGTQIFSTAELLTILEALGREWMPADWKFDSDGNHVHVVRYDGERLSVDQALNLRDLLTTTSRMVSDGRFQKRAAEPSPESGHGP